MNRAVPVVASVATLTLLVLAGCPATDDEPPPAIIAQGFDLAQPREGQLGGFSDLRLRFEVPSGIERLVIRERSYEIDLAKSPDAAQLPLFGIERRVWSKQDITLDFSPYVNGKLRSPGTYAFDMEVTDRSGRQATAELRVVIPAPEVEEAEPRIEEPDDSADSDDGLAPTAATAPSSDAALEREQPFRLERVGRGRVEGADQLAVTWHTVDEITVVIRMVAGAGRLARLEPGAYEALTTSAAWSRALDRVVLEDSLDIATANDAAAGTVVAIVRPGSRYVLRTEHSRTSLSELGTTVTLTGHYRY